MITPATEQKRQQLFNFIETELKPHAAVRGVVGIGSIATGQMRPDSDIDTLIFLDPYDRYIVPAEFMWMPKSRTFHSIFSKDPTVQKEGIPLDCVQFDLAVWSEPTYEWSEGQRAALQTPWIVYDPAGDIAQLIAERTVYNDEVRTKRLDEALIELDGHLKWIEPQTLWESLGPATAHDRIQAAYESLTQALFAYNRCWRPWRNREMTYLLALPWLPHNFEEWVLSAAHPTTLDYAGYVTRIEMLNALFDELVAQLVADGKYEEDAISQAFIRQNDEPGRAWNMDAWNEEHRRRVY